ncbi:hypothetical protein CHY_2387 [Carboxydothermus hydrogenoformans Z-2901]|uniref:Uncharacterized protein n=1 Tax=Carboxydothermus hydrogenoformans (strain ATCC BAA-161 / DSM 6008 / Z-2901) TaxID=246194 RepID=Q3A9K0_CARHZ|nr:hypothetical protein CHY_2387 [Carboxydothermus hydrogenoformans Z-2901]
MYTNAVYSLIYLILTIFFLRIKNRKRKFKGRKE